MTIPIQHPKHKGSAFETKVLLRLRELYPQTARTMGSGCSRHDKGDIINFADALIEVKHYKAISYGQLFGTDGWWNKIVKEAESINKMPVIIYKINRQPEMVVEPYMGRCWHIMSLDNWLEKFG